jgi:hypothetical protein
MCIDCACMYFLMYIHVHMYVHTYIHVYVRILHTYMHAHTYMYIYLHTPNPCVPSLPPCDGSSNRTTEFSVQAVHMVHVFVFVCIWARVYVGYVSVCVCGGSSSLTTVKMIA